MKKGDLAIAKAHVFTLFAEHLNSAELVHAPSNGDRKKCLFRVILDKPQQVLLIGKHDLTTGYYQKRDYNGLPTLQEEKNHTVWVVESVADDKWVEPYFCLESDLELANPTPDR